MATIGYARVSTRGQHTDSQEARLKEAGAERVYVNRGVSGTKASRPEWDKCMAHLRKDDLLLITKLDRVGRSLINLVDVVNVLGQRGVAIHCLDQGEVNTTSANGQLLFSIMASIAQWEAAIIRERTVEGLDAAKERHGGTLPRRGPSWTEDQARTARDLFAARETNGMSAERIAAVVGVSRATLYRMLAATEASVAPGRIDQTARARSYGDRAPRCHRGCVPREQDSCGMQPSGEGRRRERSAARTDCGHPGVKPWEGRDICGHLSMARPGRDR